MKRTALLNRHVSALVAQLGHLDEIVVADAGLPEPPGVPVIDLAVSARLPTLFQLLDVLQSEMVIEGAVYATECNADLGKDMLTTIKAWEAAQNRPIVTHSMQHDHFKDRTRSARAMIRTGDFTPYSNLILISGVPF